MYQKFEIRVIGYKKRIRSVSQKNEILFFLL